MLVLFVEKPVLLLKLESLACVYAVLVFDLLLVLCKIHCCIKSVELFLVAGKTSLLSNVFYVLL